MKVNIHDYQPGTRIYYTGDMANCSSYGVITKLNPPTKFSWWTVDILFDDERFEGDTDRITRGIYFNNFDDGPGRRFWLADEYDADRKQKLEAYIKKYSKSEVC